MGVDEFFRLRARLVELARSVHADPTRIGVLSTGEACAVALLLGRLDLLGKDEYIRSTFSTDLAPSGKSADLDTSVGLRHHPADAPASPMTPSRSTSS